MTEHIVAVFETDSAAAAAERDLQGAGILATAIRRYSRTDATAGGAVPHPSSERAEASSSGGGFWAWLMGEEPGSNRQEYSDYYERRADAGNAILSVSVADDAMIHEAVAILERHHPVELDEDTVEESGSGTAGLQNRSTAGIDYSTSDVARPAPTAVADAMMTNRASAAPTAMASGREEVVQLAEEQLDVGKRMVDRGTTRVRRYVVETPVEREVTLHGERVTVERRSPIGGAAQPGAGAFEERIVEVHETEEVPEVRKTARVVEEVAIRREATERTETVRDTVRRDEVEVSPGGEGSTSPRNR